MAEIKWAESAHHLPIEDFSPNPRNPKKHTKTMLWWKDMDGWKR